MKSKQLAKSQRIKRGTARFSFDILSYLVVGLIAILCLLPFIILISGSFSSEHAIRFTGYGLFPKEFTLEAYKIVFKTPITILRAYGVSIFITTAGTAVGLMVLTLSAYVISRKDFKYRNQFSFFFYFTTLFNGGMVSTYIFYIQYLHLKDNFLALILPGMLNVFYLLIMRSFVSVIPTALIESAKIDGAGEFKIFSSIILPLLKSGLATIGLFLALGYWNDWYNAMLYINTSEKYPLQYMLYDLLQRTQALTRISSQAGILVENLPTNTLKLSMAVVATGPIILIYPFVQKYFVKGITIGSVKG
ncbi:carbohydrate ABC transporter permease [Anaerocolumna sp. MB42-C2]|uniref:carbohydrate ABC transporter permease n=1 Tax=Anaerocolumna sp. MB42-C2 TaxID=3070997 RepID=UPI0027E12452|nr:carbohydrate ABC transporter permease [Anaerocolumna sp. MB42-C2]WMJ90307.1 carbohydrate ABC transporter permease [Anaerocolumna sp. MB42-C2]